MTPFGDIGLKVLLCFIVVGFSLRFLMICVLTSLFIFVFSHWFLIFPTGFTGKPVRRRICLYIFSLLHPLFLTKSSLISQCVAHSSSLDLNIDVASETCVPAIRMFWAGKPNMLHVGYKHVTYVLDVSRGKAGNRRGQSSIMPCTPPRPTAATGSYLQPCSWCATASCRRIRQGAGSLGSDTPSAHAPSPSAEHSRKFISIERNPLL